MRMVQTQYQKALLSSVKRLRERAQLWEIALHLASAAQQYSKRLQFERVACDRNIACTVVIAKIKQFFKFVWFSEKKICIQEEHTCSYNTNCYQSEIVNQRHLREYKLKPYGKVKIVSDLVSILVIINM